MVTNPGQDPSPLGAFAWLLRAYRARAGLSQTELASRANLSARGVSDLERGARRSPYLPTVHALAQALGLSAAEAAEFAASVPRARIASRPPPSPAVPPLPPGVLPNTFSSVIGRQGELAKLKEMLLSPAYRLITLTGPPGVGKTRLAVEVGQELSRDHGLTTVFVPLNNVRNPANVLPAIATSFGLTPDNPGVLLDMIAARLLDEHCLVILDNFEQLLPAFTDVVALLRRCANLSLLVTSRAPLLVRGEIEFPVAPLAVVPADPAAASVERVAACPAAALFLERVREHTPDFRLTAENAATVAEISRRLEGIPLAIEIAAARSALLTPVEVRHGLSRPLDFLTSGPPDLPARQRTLEDAIAWSYRLLTREQRSAFRALAMLEGTWTLEDANAVLQSLRGIGATTSRITGEIQALARHGLLITDLTDGQDLVRFRMLDLVRDFAMRQLQASGEMAAARQALFATATRFAAAAEPHLRGPDAQSWQGWLNAHLPVLQSCLRHCLDSGDIETGAGVLWTLRFLLDGGPQAWMLNWLDAALGDPSIHADPASEARLCVLSGFQRSRFGGGTAAFEEVRRGLALMTSPETDSVRAEAFDLLQRIIRDVNLPDLAMEADRFVDQLEAARETPMYARALSGRGRRRLDRRELDAAKVDLSRAVALSAYTSDRRYAAMYLAACQILQGELSVASEMLQECLEGSDQQSPIRPIPYIYAGLGRVYQRLGDRQRAAAAYGESLKRSLAIGTLFPIPLVLDGAAWLATLDHRDQVAARLLGAGEMSNISASSHSLFDSLRDREELSSRLRNRFGFHRFFTLYEEGRRMAMERAMADAGAEIARHV